MVRHRTTCVTSGIGKAFEMEAYKYDIAYLFDGNSHNDIYIWPLVKIKCVSNRKCGVYFSDEYYNSFQLSIVYLFLTNILLTVAAYSLERGERREFIHGMDLNHQRKIIEGLLHNLLPVYVTDKLRNVSNNYYMIEYIFSGYFSDCIKYIKSHQYE